MISYLDIDLVNTYSQDMFKGVWFSGFFEISNKSRSERVNMYKYTGNEVSSRI
jgi:hypothetical protein